MDSTMLKALVEKVERFRESVPVFRIRERHVTDLEEDAVAFARRFVAMHSKDEPRFDIRRLRGETRLNLPDGVRVRVFHNSGAIVAKGSLGPVEKPIVSTSDKELLADWTMEAAKRLELDRRRGDRERLEFERLWQIKATGVTRSRERGQVVLFRVVGAFRRYLHDLPVWGRASAFVQLAGDRVIDSAGVDWRPVGENPVDHARIVDPEVAARRVLAELAGGLPGGTITMDDYAPEVFSLGYFSLPKRHEQAYMQPVYVAMLRARSRMSLSRLVVVHGAASPYEPLRRAIGSPPVGDRKPEPPTRGHARPT